MNYNIDFLQNQGFMLTLLHKGQFMKKDTIFWDVDTQFDFMRPKGKFYVTGAEDIIAKVSEVRKFALENGYSIIADIDWPSLDNKEVS